ncbi:hypothetical protein AgCh_010997 [Apium graveolens]
MLAEKVILEPELRRLRNMALRSLASPFYFVAVNMKRSHDILEVGGSRSSLESSAPISASSIKLLPYGIRPVLKDQDMTFIRRVARTMPPHFALRRNRELQGLAKAVVKLWDKSAIAKIAIKRDIYNTLKERMAEELKVKLFILLILSGVMTFCRLM